MFVGVPVGCRVHFGESITDGSCRNQTTGTVRAMRFFQHRSGKIDPMDIIFLTELQADAIIGINDWERQVKQRILVDLEMATDIRKAADTDDIQHALNYKSISDRVVSYIEKSEFQLIEALTENIARIVLDEFSVNWVRVSLHKTGAIRASKDVGIRIERGSKE